MAFGIGYYAKCKRNEVDALTQHCMSLDIPEICVFEAEMGEIGPGNVEGTKVKVKET